MPIGLLVEEVIPMHKTNTTHNNHGFTTNINIYYCFTKIKPLMFNFHKDCISVIKMSWLRDLYHGEIEHQKCQCVDFSGYVYFNRLHLPI